MPCLDARPPRGARAMVAAAVVAVISTSCFLETAAGAAAVRGTIQAGEPTDVPAPAGTADPTRSSATTDVLEQTPEQVPARAPEQTPDSGPAPSGLPSVAAPRRTGPIEIDGQLTEAAWDTAGRITDLRQIDPVEGAPASEATEIRVLVDDDALYLGIRCFDREPERILASQLKRDTSLGSDDRVLLVIDPFLDRRNAFYFEVNPNGAKGDALIEDNERFRKDWDGIWFAKATIDDEGWVAELRLPFKTISFDPNAATWGLNVERVIRRKNENVRWAGVSRNTSFNSIADAGFLSGMTDLDQGAGIDVKPFGTGTFSRDSETGENDADFDAGLDVFWKLTPEFTLSLTLNTDFAETEVDERQVNLTRFPLFFPEKRDFFLQDAGIFEFGGINRNPLPFFSRRIGLAPDGEQRDILAGAKLTGRIDDWNVGVLNVQMQADDELGDKNLGVARISRNVFGQSTIGAIATYGDPNARGDSALGGLDFNLREQPFGDSRVLDGHAWIQYADDVDRGGDTAYGFKIGYPNDRVRWDFGATEIGEDFDAALGFVPRRGIREYFGNWRYRHRPDESSWLRWYDVRLRTFVVTNLDNTVESMSTSIQPLVISTDDGDFFSVQLQRVREQLFDDFEIVDGVTIPAGDYWWNRFELDLGTTSSRPVDVGAEFRWGGFYGGNRSDVETSINWRVSPNLFLGGSFEMNDVNLPEGDFITRLVRARVNVFFSPEVSWTTFAQYDSVSDTIGVNSRIRWIVQPGNEVFIVLNQAVDRDGSSYRVTGTELTTKVGWTFRF